MIVMGIGERAAGEIEAGESATSGAGVGTGMGTATGVAM